METLLRIQIDIICIAFLAVASASIERRSAARSRGRAYDVELFRLLVLSTYSMLIIDAAGWLLDGAAGRIAHFGLYAVNSLYFALHALPTALYILYADYQVNRDPGRLRRLAKAAAAIVAVMAAFALSTPLTRLIFSIDASNHYVRGPAFPFLIVFFYGLVVFSLVSVVAGRKKAGPRVFRTLLAYPLTAVATAAAQHLYFGLVLFWPATTVFIVAAAINIQRRRGATDHLTGTANRRGLDEELERRVWGPGSARAFGGILVDLDDFKSINDRLGHEAGDRALEDAAAILKSAVRQEDFVARFGGDEFVLILRDSTLESLSEVAERLRGMIESHNASAGRPYRLSFSVGSAIYDPESDGSPSRFLTRLDEAMYADKAARR